MAFLKHLLWIWKLHFFKKGAKAYIIAPHLGFISTDQGGEIPVDYSFLTSSSVLFDAVFIADGQGLASLDGDGDVLEFINDAYKHCKTIGADGAGIGLLAGTNFAQKTANQKDDGLIISETAGDRAFAENFINAMAQHRFWQRENIL